MEKIKFTTEEQTFIDHCFNSTLHIFVENPLNRDNTEDIRKAVNYRNYNIGSIGVKNHEYMHSIFDKMGYCRDGKTTKDEEYQRELALEKEKAEIWTKTRDLALVEVKNKMKELRKLEKELLNHDTKFNEVIKKKAKIAQTEFKEKMKEERRESQSLLIQETRKSVDDMNLRELRLMAKQRKIINYSRMKKVDLLEAVKEAG